MIDPIGRSADNFGRGGFGGQISLPHVRRSPRNLRQHRRGDDLSVFVDDSTGASLTGANTLTYHFAKDQLPPVHAFWSLTLYELRASQLVANPLNRYLINSPMLPRLERGPRRWLYVLSAESSPRPDKESNWLPAPKGPFMVVLRLYWPKPDALNGTWKAPKPDKA